MKVKKYLSSRVKKKIMKVKDRVKMSPMWKYDSAVGSVTKVTKEYIIVKWDNIPGVWHYTEAQSKRLELIDE